MSKINQMFEDNIPLAHNLSSYDFVLPPELIAQEPTQNRSESRLLHCILRNNYLHNHQRDPKNTTNPDCNTNLILSDRQFCELPEILLPGDLVIMNNTNVLPAHLQGHIIRNDSTHPLSIHFNLITKIAETENYQDWQCLAKPFNKISQGDTIRIISEKSSFLQNNLALTNKTTVEHDGFSCTVINKTLTNLTVRFSYSITDFLQKNRRVWSTTSTAIYSTHCQI